MDFKKTIKITILTSSIALSVSARAQQTIEVVQASRASERPRITQQIEAPLQTDRIGAIRDARAMKSGATALEPQKIFPVRVTTTPTTATFTFITQRATSAHIEIGKRPPDEVPQFRDRDRIGKLLPPYPVQELKKHSFKAVNLKPATVYYYIVRVPGDNGGFLTATGSFTTPIRID
jgi:hypothetical protein